MGLHGRPAMRAGLARVAVVVAAVLAALLLAAAPAAAHTVSGVGATNFRTTITGVTPEVPGMRLTVVENGSRLQLRNDTTTAVVVRGYEGEPYARIGPDGVFLNDNSPATYLNANRYSTITVPARADPKAPPAWRKVSSGQAYRWHDHRTHWMLNTVPPAVAAAPAAFHRISAWTVTLDDGGRVLTASGTLDWVPGPSPWGWLAGAALLALAVTALGMLRRPQWWLAATTALLVLADATHAVAIALVTAGGSGGALGGSIAAELVAWVVPCIAVLLLARRRIGAVWLSAMAGVSMLLTTGVPDLPTLWRSSAPTALPLAADRTTVLIALGAGTGLLAVLPVVLRRQRRLHPSRPKPLSSTVPPAQRPAAESPAPPPVPVGAPEPVSAGAPEAVSAAVSEPVPVAASQPASVVGAEPVGAASGPAPEAASGTAQAGGAEPVGAASVVGAELVGAVSGPTSAVGAEPVGVASGADQADGAELVGQGSGAVSRRHLVGYATATGLGGLAGMGIAVAARAPDPVNPSQGGAIVVPLGSVGTRTVAFYGEHQAGIVTPARQQARTCVTAFDLRPGADREVLRALLRRWTAAAASLTQGQPVSGNGDTIAVGSGPASLTITVGFGPSLFGKAGLPAAARPAALAPLPSFPGERLDPARSDGDLGVLICANDPLVVFHAARTLQRLAAGTATARWQMNGFCRTPGAASSEEGTQRNLMGQLDGTNNPHPTDPTFSAAVFASTDAQPSWLQGGSFLVVRRIRMLLNMWDGLSVTDQEKLVGRRKDNGAPLSGGSEFTPANYGTRAADGSFAIPENAHIRLASAAFNNGSAMLRRGYSYADGIAADGAGLDAGLLFMAWQADPRTGFIPVHRQLIAADALNPYIRHETSALFGMPGGVAEGQYLGHLLLES